MEMITETTRTELTILLARTRRRATGLRAAGQAGFTNGFYASGRRQPLSARCLNLAGFNEDAAGILRIVAAFQESPDSGL
jgi:hypothetical protein